MEENHDNLNTVFQALADPTRRAVIQHLINGPASVTELAEPFEMALPSFMKHIGVLEDAGLIRSKKTGRVRTCEIKSKQLTAAQKWINTQTAIWEGRMARMASYVETLDAEEQDDLVQKG
ncbi:ArsR/SmtB family transcription factor [Microbulbifer sp. TRSA002]|uniref:ArsR/SmtB family transcription factor n=1 Tax=Microbulbifer sp. TRSA002 TaxID=3243382 RepID=UPI004039208D